MFQRVQQSAEKRLATPTFQGPITCVAGIRPYRRHSFRLERERIPSHPNKFLVHNYGHGGAGISLSWGVAMKVRDIIKAHMETTSDRTVAVLGSGVIGMTTARLLVELGLRVTIYAKEPWNETTSKVAGGQWAPSTVDCENVQLAKDVIRASYKKFVSSIGSTYGVSKVPNYTKRPQEDLDKVIELFPPGTKEELIPARQPVSQLPFGQNMGAGFLYQTLLIEPPIFLKQLHTELVANNVPVRHAVFSTPGDVFRLPENIIVNCTGFGARELWDDKEVVPVKGHLAMLPPQPDLKYLFSRNGQMFARSDAVVIGGTMEPCIENRTPYPSVCQSLVDDIKGVFGLAPMVERFAFHIDHPSKEGEIAPLIGGGTPLFARCREVQP
jgi:glycine/D-amino acid oxidase-like deaminating enzyme